MANEAGIDLRGIIKKTGHHLQEIRLRALENILSKLRNQIIFIEDLVHNRELMVNLLQWFNYENPEKVDDVLNLIECLSKNGAAASILQSIGAVEFFSTLRQDIEKKEHLDLIDSILNSIFWIQAENSEQLEDVNEATEIQHVLTHTAKENDIVPVTSFDNHDGYRRIDDRNISATQSSFTQKSELKMDSRSMLIVTSAENEGRESADRPTAEEIAIGHSVLSAEWIVLTSSDRHILSVTDSRVQSHNVEIVGQSCEFFRDVLLQDFPAHIFIQRPSIVKALLGLLESYAGKDEDIVSVLLECLTELTLKLLKSSLQDANPDLLQISKINEIYSSTESSVHTEISSLRSRTTSVNEEAVSKQPLNSIERDLGSNIESDAEDFEGELLTEALQQSQWTVLDYCLRVLSSAVTFAVQAIQGSNRCEEVILLINYVLDVLSLYELESVWNGDVSRKVYDIMTCLRYFSDLVQLCLDTKDRIVQQSEISADIESIYAILANAAALSVRFINLSVPTDRVFEAVPENLLGSYQMLCVDEIMAQSYPPIRISLLNVMKAADDSSYESYQMATTVISSMKTTKTFMEEAQNMGVQSNNKMQKILELCKRSLSSVGFHQFEPFVKSAVKLVSHAFKLRDPIEDVIATAEDIVLCLLSHHDEKVRVMAYQTCLDIVTNALGDSHVTQPLSSAYQGAFFIINTDVLYEIAAFGLNSPNKKIANIAVNIIVTLMFGRLNMPAKTWQSFICKVIPVFPLLQCFAPIDKAFERALTNIADATNALLASDGQVCLLPPLEQLRASFRFMFVKDDHIRAKGFSSLVWTLTQEDSKDGRSARYRHETVQEASDIFLVGPSLSSKHQQEISIPSGFSGSNLEHLWDVFCSSSIDESLKESAAEQLTILMQDPKLHKELLDKDADKIILNTLHSYVKKINSFSLAPMETSMKMLVSCVSMLRRLVQHNVTVRHTLAVDKSLYMDTFRCRIVFIDDDTMHYETSCLIAFLIFDEFFQRNKDGVALPSLITKGYLLPFSSANYEISTKHREKHGETKEMKVLREDPFHSMIRINWNIILSGNSEDIQEDSRKEDAAASNSKRGLKLTKKEIIILAECLPKTLMKKHLDILRNSDNPITLSIAMKDLRQHILTMLCQFNAYPSTGREEIFANIYKEFVLFLQDQNLFKRLFNISAKKTTYLQSLIRFCKMLSVICSKLPLKDMSSNIFKQFLEGDGVVSSAITKYTILRSRQPDASRSERETYDIKNENRALFKSVLALVSTLSTRLNSEGDPTNLFGLGNFILLIMQSLNRVDSTSYYDLPVLEITVDCLSHMTFKKGWSLQYGGSGEDLCTFMANLFIQILHSFHVDRMGVSTSFMGKGVMSKAALCLCHVAIENETFCKDKDWTATWVLQTNAQPTDGEIDNSLPWLLPLLTDRSLDIRWCGWSLSTALLNGTVGAESVVNEFQVFPGGVWASAVGVILDEHENSLIRSQACKLISTSITKLNSVKDKTDYDLWEGMVVQDTQTQMNITGLPAFHLLLDHFQFFSKMKEHLLQKAYQHPITNSIAYHNVSTSCSTPASEVDQYYAQISSESRDEESIGASVSMADSEVGSKKLADGSSSECLLLSSTDSFSDASQDVENVYRFSIQSQEQKRETRNVENRRHCCTVRLKSSFFQLIYKLIESDPENVIQRLETDDLLNTMIGLLDCNFSSLYIVALSKDNHISPKTIRCFTENAEMTENLLKIVNLVVSNSKAITLKLVNEVKFSSSLVSIFQIPANLYSGSSLVNKALYSLWNEALKLLIKLSTHNQDFEDAPTETCVIRKFKYFAASYYFMVSNGKSAQDTIILFLLLLRCILCRDGRRSKKDRTLCDILDSPCDIIPFYKRNDGLSVADGVKDTIPLTIGEFFCKVFIDQLDRSQSSGKGKKAVLSTLSTLFVVSMTSKTYAVKIGFLESVIEDIKDVHVKLNLASLHLDKEDPQRTKEKAFLLELVDIFGLLRNAVYGSLDSKNAAVKAGLLISIQKLWSWCLLDRALKMSALELLVVLTAQCSKAHEAICHGSSSNQKAVAHDDNSLFQSIFKLLLKLHKDCMAPTGKIENATKIAFQLFTNIVVMPDARSLLMKNNFLQNFKSCHVGQSANKKQKAASRILTALWVQFLLVMSFYADGAHAILKVNDMLLSLIDIASDTQHRERTRCLIILRNLLFFPSNKPMLITNSDLTSCLLNALDTKSIWTRAIVVTCFASLLHNCHKAKVALKKTKLLAKLQLLNEEILTGKMLCIDGKTEGYDQLKVSLKKTIQILTK